MGWRRRWRGELGLVDLGLYNVMNVGLVWRRGLLAGGCIWYAGYDDCTMRL